MATGVIKTKTDKGFGFIQPDGADPMDRKSNVFFHSSECGGQYDSLSVGQKVTFDQEQGEKGPKATNVVAAD
jgi:CspA family cold shock protein